MVPSTTERFHQTLSLLPFVTCVEHSDAPNSLIAPPVLVSDMYVFDDEGISPRIDRCRAKEALDAWREDQMRAFGLAAEYFIYPCSGNEWCRLEVRWPEGLLTALWDHGVPYVLLLSAGGDRALLLTDLNGEFSCTVRSVAESVSRTELRERLSLLLLSPAEFLPVPRAALDVEVTWSRVRAQRPPFATLPAKAPASRLDRWLADSITKLRAHHRHADFNARGMDGMLGPYYLTIAKEGALPWTLVYTWRAVEWLPALWRAGDLAQLLIMSHDQTLVLGLRRTATQYEAYLYPTEPR